jgi:preprotein translocase subunit SecD
MAIETPTRNTKYDPTYTPPKIDPSAQKGLTDMLSRFGIDYPNAPRATPQLLAFMRGLGMSYDSLQDIQRNTVARVQGRSADSMQNIERSNQIQNRAITGSLQSNNVLSSGAANTRYAEQVENVLAQQSDVARAEAEGIGEATDALAAGQDRLRTDANERIINEEERQATADALAQENVRDFNSRRDESDYQNALAEAARKEALKAQEDFYANNGLGVK